MRIVLDTSIIVDALIERDSAAREVLKLCFSRQLTPLIGTSLFLEMEAALGTDALSATSSLGKVERQELLAAFISVSEWVTVYYALQPSLSADADNHIVELAVAGGARVIVTRDIGDFAHVQLSFPEMSVMNCRQILQTRRP
jgi:putative PIN family toxin of toxin-antitoxin system